MKMKSSLSSPMTAISPPVASLRMSLLESGSVGIPAGVEIRLPPRETRPEALMRMRCPRRTTSPVLVHPLDVLSPRTRVFIWKKVGLFLDEGCCAVLDGALLTVSSGGGWTRDAGCCCGAGREDC